MWNIKEDKGKNDGEVRGMLLYLEIKEDISEMTYIISLG